MQGKRNVKPFGLTPVQLAYVEEFMEDRHQTDAVRRAFPHVKNPRQYAVNLMKVPAVRAEIDRRLAAASAKADVTIERVAREMALLAFSNLADFVTVQDDGTAVVDFAKLKELPEDQQRDKLAALAEFTVDEYDEGRGEYARPVKKMKLKLWDKRAALESLGMHLGGFKRRSELSGPNGGPIPTAAAQVTLTTDDPLEAARLYQKLVAGA